MAARFLGVQLEFGSSVLSRLDALNKAQQMTGKLESAMQSPLDLKEWIYETPERTARLAKEQTDE